MWQHEIIEHLQKRKEYMNEHNLDLSVSQISSFPCFFFGEASGYLKNATKDFTCPKENPDGVTGFPFRSFIFEYRETRPVKSPERTPSSKKALVVAGVGERFRQEVDAHREYYDDDVYKSYIESDAIFYQFAYFDTYKEWMCSPVISLIKQGRAANYIQGNPLYKKEFVSQDLLDKSTINLQESLGDLFLLLNFLNCRNVYTETIVPPIPLNKKREKNGKPPMVEYKILKVQKGIPKEKYTKVVHPWGKIPRDIITAQHICRGHFKEYGEDGKLFGKYTGRFWWGPQVRGSLENGQIVKEYDVRQ